MARNRTRLRDYSSNAGKSEVEINLQENELKARRERQNAAMDEKIKEMGQKAVNFLQLYGAEDYRYQMMVTFLDVAFQMKDAITLIQSVQVATSYLSTAIEFIDDSIKYEDMFNEQLLSVKYGPFARFKRWLTIRRAARNNRRRLETAIKNMTTRLEMAHQVTDSLRDGFDRMRASMAKSEERRRKREAKRAAKSGQPVTTPTQSRAQQYINELAGNPSAGVPASGATAPTSGESGSPAPDRGIDDIL